MGSKSKQAEKPSKVSKKEVDVKDKKEKAKKVVQDAVKPKAEAPLKKKRG